MASQLVDKTVGDEELCVRCIHHPLMYSASKNKLKEEAFQPKWNERDASLLRLRYCDEDFCIAHGQKIDIKDCVFVGLAKIRPMDVKAVNEWAGSEESKMKYEGENEKPNGMTAQIVYAPMDGNDYVDTTIDVYTESVISLPMHVDLRYNDPLNDDVKTRIRHYARKLASKAMFEKKV